MFCYAYFWFWNWGCCMTVFPSSWRLGETLGANFSCFQFLSSYLSHSFSTIIILMFLVLVFGSSFFLPVLCLCLMMGFDVLLFCWRPVEVRRLQQQNASAEVPCPCCAVPPVQCVSALPALSPCTSFNILQHLDTFCIIFRLKEMSFQFHMLCRSGAQTIVLQHLRRSFLPKAKITAWQVVYRNEEHGLSYRLPGWHFHNSLWGTSRTKQSLKKP